VSGERELDDLLATDPVDAGCAAGFEVLHRYVEAELSGGDPDAAYPGLAAHLRCCPACRQDHEGLIEASRLFGDADVIADSSADSPDS
jgi:hypothetical protein